MSLEWQNRSTSQWLEPCASPQRDCQTRFLGGSKEEGGWLGFWHPPCSPEAAGLQVQLCCTPGRPQTAPGKPALPGPCEQYEVQSHSCFLSNVSVSRLDQVNRSQDQHPRCYLCADAVPAPCTHRPLSHARLCTDCPLDPGRQRYMADKKITTTLTFEPKLITSTGFGRL